MVDLKYATVSLIASGIIAIGLLLLLVYFFSPSIWLPVLLGALGFVGFGYVLYKTKRLRKIVGYSMIALGLEAFASPLAIGVWSAKYTAQAAQNGTIAAAGAGIGGGVITVVAGFLGFFLGLILIIAGYFVQRVKK